MSDKLNITRRDFMNGVALSVAAGSSISPLELLAATGSAYPPALMGLRGSHPGSFEVSHALAWGGATWPRPAQQSDGVYDLVVVGGGLSGLAAAFLYQQRTGGGMKVLVLDNHDDFGGHAKRNEFTVDGQNLICYGGSQSIDTPGQYSAAAKQLLVDAGIQTERFYDYFDRDYFRERELGRGMYFSREVYGEDSVHPNVTRGMGERNAHDLASIVNEFPLSAESRQSLLRLLVDEDDYLKGKSQDEKLDALRAMSYMNFLTDLVEVTPEAATVLRDTTRGYWGVGWDALSALEAYRGRMPGTRGMGLGELKGEPPGRNEPYIFHFPDGNAGVARSLVRKLVPDAVPGSTMEDIVKSRVDYELLDRVDNDTRIRLSSTAVKVEHADNERYVDVTYVHNGTPHRVRGKHAVLACYNGIVPHLCAEVPEKQVEAINYATKVPLVYISVAVRNWRAFENLGYSTFYIPRGILMHSFGMDFPVSMGGYDFTQDSSQPTVLHGTYVPTQPGEGLNAREQHIAGRRKLYEQSYDELEAAIVRQMSGALEGGGFDAERDIAGITVNRWPHGYAYEYNDFADPKGYNRYNGPHIAGAAQLGRISIANSDAAGFAYVNGAFDAADRAVNEQLAEGGNAVSR